MKYISNIPEIFQKVLIILILLSVGYWFGKSSQPDKVVETNLKEYQEKISQLEKTILELSKIDKSHIVETETESPDGTKTRKKETFKDITLNSKLTQDVSTSKDIKQKEESKREVINYKPQWSFGLSTNIDQLTGSIKGDKVFSGEINTRVFDTPAFIGYQYLNINSNSVHMMKVMGEF